jgi:hypothetical protein
MLQTCADHLEKDNSFQAIAVLGISLIAMGEELGSEMSLRTFDHLLQVLYFGCPAPLPPHTQAVRGAGD